MQRLLSRPVLLLLLALAALASVASAGGSWPFSLGIRDSIMIAHSFKGEQFGPAQKVRVGAWVGRWIYTGLRCLAHLATMQTMPNA